MARVINGTIFVPAFNGTATPGEWTFSGATYDNQSDTTGNGAYDLQIGFLVYVQATDLNTAFPLNGVYHRYKITSITASDSVTIDATIFWDEAREPVEIDSPTNGSFCGICEPTVADDFGAVPAVGVYPSLGAGSDIGSYVSDMRNRIDADVYKKYTNVEGSAINRTQFVFESSAGNVELVRADDALKPGTVIAIVYDTTVDDATIGRFVVKFGYRMKGFSGLVVGAPCYISRTTAGAISQNLTGWLTGEHVFYLGEALASDEIIFNPEYEVEY